VGIPALSLLVSPALGTGAGRFEPQDGELGSAALIVKSRPIEQQSCSELTGFRA
jgi:hypothetical protein